MVQNNTDSANNIANQIDDITETIHVISDYTKQIAIFVEAHFVSMCEMSDMYSQQNQVNTI